MPKQVSSLMDFYIRAVPHVSFVSRPIVFEELQDAYFPLSHVQPTPSSSSVSFEHSQYYKRAGRSGDRILVGLKFTAPVQTGPRTHPAFFTMGTESFPEVKRPRLGFDHPPPSSAEDEGRVELYICSHSGPSWSAEW
jgi:hypothetical protein